MTTTSGAVPLWAYRMASRAASPWLPLILGRRARCGREEAARLGERFGIAGRARPDGAVAWLHAASVGELLSLLPLLEALARDAPPFTALVTSGTVTSAAIAAERLPAGAVHQYAPVDTPDAVRRFLAHWRPRVALRVDSEIWPNQIEALRAAGVPSLLVNARLSPRSAARWRRFPGLARRLFGAFDLILAQSPVEAARLREAAGREVAAVGNLKAMAGPLPADPDAVAAMADRLAGRPVWVLASSHPGEEAMAARAHRALASAHPGLVTVVVPRHPDRGPAIAADLAGDGTPVALRSAGAVPGPDAGIYVADTLGELGLWYRVVAVAVAGGSLVPHGGQNPLEAAVLGLPVLFGPHMDNFQAMADGLLSAGGARRTTAAALARDVGALLTDGAARAAAAAAAQAEAARQREAAAGIAAAVLPWFRGGA